MKNIYIALFLEITQSVIVVKMSEIFLYTSIYSTTKRKSSSQLKEYRYWKSRLVIPEDKRNRQLCNKPLSEMKYSTS